MKTPKRVDLDWADGTGRAVACPKGNELGDAKLLKCRHNGEEHRWFALAVRAQREKVVSRSLQAKGYTVCDAVTRCRRAWSDRVKQVDVPLFPGYVFCQFDPLFRLPIVTTPYVDSVIGFGGVPEPVQESEMEAVRTLLQSGLPVQAWPYLRVGDRVRIAHGALKDVEGILTQVKNHHRLVVSVTLLQRSVAVEIEDVFVRPGSRRPRG